MSDERTEEVETCEPCQKGDHYGCLSRYGIRCACFDAQSPKAKLEAEASKARESA